MKNPISFVAFRGQLYAYLEAADGVRFATDALAKEIERKRCTKEEAKYLDDYWPIFTYDEIANLTMPQLFDIWTERALEYVFPRP